MLVLSVTLLSIAEVWSLRYTVCQRNHTNALEKELFLRNSEFWVRGKTSNKAVHGYYQMTANVRKFLLTGNYITDCWWGGVATNYKIFARKQKSELKTIAGYWSKSQITWFLEGSNVTRGCISKMIFYIFILAPQIVEIFCNGTLCLLFLIPEKQITSR